MTKHSKVKSNFGFRFIFYGFDTMTTQKALTPICFWINFDFFKIEIKTRFVSMGFLNFHTGKRKTTQGGIWAKAL